MTFSLHTFRYTQNEQTGSFSALQLIANDHLVNSKKIQAMGISRTDLKLFQHDVTTIEPRNKYIIVSISYTSYIIRREGLAVITLNTGVSECHSRCGEDEFVELLAQAYTEEITSVHDLEVCKYPEFVYLATILKCELTRLRNSLDRAQELISTLSKSVPDNLKESVADLNALVGEVSAITNAFKYLFDDDLEVLALCFENQISRRRKVERDNVLTNQPFHFPKYGIQTDSETSDSSDSISDEDYRVPLDTILTFLEKYYFEMQGIGSTATILKQKITDTIFFSQLQLDTKRNFFLALDAVLGVISCGCLLVNGMGNFFGANILNPWNAQPAGPLSSRDNSVPDIVNVTLWIACPAVAFIVLNLYILIRVMRKNKRNARIQDLILQTKS